jgi:hypothetical protein
LTRAFFLPETKIHLAIFFYISHEHTSVVEPRAKEPKLNGLSEAEQKLKNAAPAPAQLLFIYHSFLEILKKKRGCWRRFL